MITIYESIRDALVSLLKGAFSDFDVFCEEISKTQDGVVQPVLTQWIFLDLIPSGNETVSADFVDRSILIDIAVHTESELNRDYLQISQQLEPLLRPVFRFSDGGESRAITVPDVSFKMVDRVLHCTFTLSFRDSRQEPPAGELMEELEGRFQ